MYFIVNITFVYFFNIYVGIESPYSSNYLVKVSLFEIPVPVDPYLSSSSRYVSFTSFMVLILKLVPFLLLSCYLFIYDYIIAGYISYGIVYVSLPNISRQATVSL